MFVFWNQHHTICGRLIKATLGRRCSQARDKLGLPKSHLLQRAISAEFRMLCRQLRAASLERVPQAPEEALTPRIK